MSGLISILLVEDEVFDQLAFNRFIQREGLSYEATIVSTIQEARLKLSDHTFDVIISDYHLGPDSGLDLLEEVKDIPFIVITGLGDEDVAVKAMKLGASDYITKDMQGHYLKTLPQVVENAIRLKRAEIELNQYRKSLEKMVAERTEELTLANERLRQEILERKQAEAQVKLQATALDSAINGIMITDIGGKIIWANPSFENMVGYSLNEIIGKQPDFFRTESSDSTPFTEYWGSVQIGKFWRGEMTVLGKDSPQIIVEMTITPGFNDEGQKTFYVAICQDITENVLAREQLEYQATHDLLTGLPNRLLFSDRLDHAVALAKRNRTEGAIMLLDLDNFKSINDAFSHEYGDEFLKIIAINLKECLRDSDTVARIGGDEFAILLENIDQDAVSIVAHKVNQELSKPLKIGENTIVSTASIGISIFPQDGNDFVTLFKNADLAMYQAKEEKNAFQYYSQEMTIKVTEQMDLTNYLHYALQNEIFELHYQPQVNAETGKVIGLEALIRLPHPERGWISPSEFIPLAEKIGIISSIDEWVLKEVGKTIRNLLDAGFSETKISVNLSNRLLLTKSLFHILKMVLERYNLDPGTLELEISENNLFQNVDKTIYILSELKTMGLKIAMDDFGTGFSSLNYLAQFPLDTMKIDLSFTQKVPASKSDVAIIKGVIEIANSLGLNIIVEGVENKEQLDFFFSRACHLIQGFFYSRPVPFYEVEDIMRRGFTSAKLHSSDI